MDVFEVEAQAYIDAACDEELEVEVTQPETTAWGA